jgi:hypothetical protein
MLFVKLHQRSEVLDCKARNCQCWHWYSPSILQNAKIQRTHFGLGAALKHGEGSSGEDFDGMYRHPGSPDVHGHHGRVRDDLAFWPLFFYSRALIGRASCVRGRDSVDNVLTDKTWNEMRSEGKWINWLMRGGPLNIYTGKECRTPLGWTFNKAVVTS